MNWILLLKTAGITLAATSIVITAWLIHGYLKERRRPQKSL